MRRLREWFLYEGRPVRITVNSGKERPLHGQRPALFHCVGVLFNPKALWIGGHYSKHHKRWCINILPCLTVWWTKPGGYLP